jgi:hypothetical protein
VRPGCGGPIVALITTVFERTRDLSDSVTLIAGILLTSAGLLALLPYVLKQGWQRRTGNLAVDSGFASVMAAVDAFEAEPGPERPATGVEPEMEELLAQLFSLRMTVSEVTAEVEDTRVALEEGAPDDSAADAAVEDVA